MENVLDDEDIEPVIASRIPDSNPCKRRKTSSHLPTSRGVPIMPSTVGSSLTDRKDVCSATRTEDSMLSRPAVGTKRRVSFHAQTRVRELRNESHIDDVSSTQTSPQKSMNNFSFHQSFREKLNRTCEINGNSNNVTSPFPGIKRSGALNSGKLFSTSSNAHMSFYNSPLSKSFNVGSSASTPQLPLGESRFYKSTKGVEGMQNSPLVPNSNFDPTVFASPNFGTNLTLPNRGLNATATPTRYKIRRSSRSNVPLSGNAQKILEKLEQPVTHTEIHRMRTMGPLKSVHDFNPISKVTDVNQSEGSQESDVPKTSLPSFSFLSSRRVMPPLKAKITPPKLKDSPQEKGATNPSAKKLSEADSNEKQNHTTKAEKSEFSFAPPTPKKYDFNQDNSSSMGTASNSKSVPFKLAETSKPKSSTTVSETNAEEDTSKIKSLAERLKPPAGSWNCELCLSRNEPDRNKCAACETPKKIEKPVKIENKSTVFSDAGKSSLSGQSIFPITSNKLAEKFKTSAGTWSCDTCLVQNKSGDDQCVACLSKKPVEFQNSAPMFGVTSTMPLASNKLAEKFKMSAGTWSCDVCLIQNKSEDDKCVACETSKPGSSQKSSASNGPSFKTNPKVFSAVKSDSSKPQIKFGVINSTDHSAAFGGGSSLFKPCSNPISSETSGFKFGVSSTNSSIASSFVSNSSIFSMPKTNAVEPKISSDKPDQPFVFGSSNAIAAKFDTNFAAPKTTSLMFGAKSTADNATKSDSIDGSLKKNVTFSFSMPSAKGDIKMFSANNNDLVAAPKMSNGDASKTPAFATPLFSFSNPPALGSGFKTDSSAPKEPVPMFMFNAPSKRA